MTLMTRKSWRWICLAGLLASGLVSTGCSSLVRESVRDGVLSYISGGLSSSFREGGAFNGLLNDLLTGGLFNPSDVNTSQR